MQYDISKVRVFWGPKGQEIELTPYQDDAIDISDMRNTPASDWSECWTKPEFDLPPISKAPRQPNQHHRFYCMMSATEAGEHRHPQRVVRDLAATLNFVVLGAVPQSIADGWDFWIEYDANGDYDDSTEPPAFPAYFRAASWKPINQP